MAIETEEITITSANFKTLNSIPIELLPAPASGYARQYLGITFSMVYNSVPYATASVIIVYTVSASTNPYVVDSAAFLESSDQDTRMLPGTAGAGPFTTTRALKITADADPTAGNSDMVYSVVFQDILINP